MRLGSTLGVDAEKGGVGSLEPGCGYAGRRGFDPMAARKWGDS